MAKYRLKEEKLHRVRLGSRYFGFNLAQYFWECLKLVAGSEGLRETDIVRRIIGSWIETLPPSIREKARTEENRAEAWKAQELLARRHAKRKAKLAKLRAHQASSPKEGSPGPPGSFRRQQRLAAND